MGLKDVWQVDAPSSGPAVDSEQGKKFVTDFKAAVDQVNQSLQYTVTYAEESKHDALAGRRDPLVQQFQQALAKIDPADTKKAEADIGKTLSAVRQLQTDAAALKQQVEQAVQAWQAMEPKFDAAGDQVAELQDWGTPEAGGFAQQVETIRADVNARRYEGAKTACEQLLAGVEPAVKAMQEQKDAQARYEPAWEAVQPRLEEARQCEFASMAALQDELGTIETQMTGAADARDYVEAETVLADLTTKVDQCLAMRDELAEKKTAYDEAYAALQPRIPTTSEPGGERIVTLQGDIAAKVDDMTAAAAADDYDTALRLAGELDPQLTELETALAARQRYDEQLAALQPRLPQAATGSPALADLESQISSLQQQAETAAAADDYEQACTHLTALEPVLAEHEAAKAKLEEQKLAYEQARAALEQHLPTATEPGEGRLAEVQTGIQQSLADADAAEAAEDYETALEHLKALEGQLAELETLLAARDEYQSRLARLEPRLPTSGGAAAGRLAEVQTEIETLRADAEAAAGSSDFETALQKLTELEELLGEFEELSSQRDQFEERWAELQPRLPQDSEPDATPEVIEINDSIVQARTSLESKAAEGDYEGALCEVDELVRLVSDLDAAKEAAVRQREEFEQAYAGMKQTVEMAVAAQTDVPAVQEKQQELADRKAEVDAAVAQNDYETAQSLLEDVDVALKAYEEELRKEPRNCDWINATATSLMAGIMRHYMQAQGKIDRAAQAYDDALAAHKAAVEAVDARKQLVADLLTGIFFAGLGGAVGGAVGGALKSSVEGAFKKAAESGAILDATKDIAKFTTRSLQQLGGSAGDPTSVSANFGANGVELARGVGQAVHAQGDALLAEVQKLANLVRDNPEACDSKEGIRVEGDPAAAMDSDPFLAVLGTIASADKRTFAKLLWGSWIEAHAFSIDEKCDEWGDCTAVVEDDIEDFWGWWADLTKNIEAQAGSDFGLRAKIDAARKQVQEKVDAKNRENFYTR